LLTITLSPVSIPLPLPTFSFLSQLTGLTVEGANGATPTIGLVGFESCAGGEKYSEETSTLRYVSMDNVKLPAKPAPEPANNNAPAQNNNNNNNNNGEKKDDKKPEEHKPEEHKDNNQNQPPKEEKKVRGWDPSWVSTFLW